MATAARGGCCRFCLKFLVTSGLTALFLWLSLRTSNPTCSIQDFYLPALNKTANSTANHTLYFDLKLDNGMKDKGIFYDALNLTFYYGPNPHDWRPVGNATFPGFYQGHNKKARRKQLVETRGVPWETVPTNGTAVFRVDLATGLRFKILFWKTKRSRLTVGSTIGVNESGKKAAKKGVKLKSRAPPGLPGHGGVPGCLLIVFTVFVLLFT